MITAPTARLGEGLRDRFSIRPRTGMPLCVRTTAEMVFVEAIRGKVVMAKVGITGGLGLQKKKKPRNIITKENALDD